MRASTLRICVAASAIASFGLPFLAPQAAEPVPVAGPMAMLLDQLALLRDGHGIHDWLVPDRVPSVKR